MIFTVNIIDWQQSVLDNSNPVSNQVWKNTMLMLDILRKNEVTGTFFIQNKVASKYPVLVRKIESEGHEVGCFIDTRYNTKTVESVVHQAIQHMEGITGTKVIGTRTQGLSLSRSNFYTYCRYLKKNGVRYDSSLISNRPLNQHENKNISLEAFDDYQIAQYTLPSLLKLPGLYDYSVLFGGNAFRLLPYEFNLLLGNQLNKDTSVFSLPVYALGISDYTFIKSFHQLSPRRRIDFIGRQSIPNKLQKLLADYPFDSFRNYYYYKTI